MRYLQKTFAIIFICSTALICSSCTSSVGLAAGVVAGATYSVAKTIVKAPFKIAGAFDENDNDETKDSNESD